MQPSLLTRVRRRRESEGIGSSGSGVETGGSWSSHCSIVSIRLSSGRHPDSDEGHILRLINGKKINSAGDSMEEDRRPKESEGTGSHTGG